MRHRLNYIRPSKPIHGFTLIELLVVIAIISLLVSILLPSLKKAKELANSAVCKSNLRALVTGASLYSSDWDGILPGVVYPAWWWYGSAGKESYWYREIGEYVDVTWGWSGCWTTVPEGKRTVFCCPSVPDFQLNTSFVKGNHYSYNLELSYRKLSDISGPVTLLTDGREYMFVNDRYSPMVSACHWLTGTWSALPFDRHVDGINMAGYDGSVTAASEDEISEEDLDDSIN